MSRPIACGIDFGTTNSSIAASVDGRVEVLQAEPGADPPEVLRSIAFLHRDGDRWAGRDAARRYLLSAGVRHRCGACDRVEWLKEGPYTECRQFKPGGGCLDARLISGIKPLLPELSSFETSSWAEVFGADDLVAVILSRLKALADARFGPVERVVLGYPVTFEASSGGEGALERLGSAAGLAGFEQVRFCPEPIAAVSQDIGSYRGKTICSVDFGGGTFDVAILSFASDVSGESELLALGGVPVGGGLFDGLLFEHFVAPHLPLDVAFEFKEGRAKQLPAYIRRGMRSLDGVTLLAAEPLVYTTLMEYSSQTRNPVQLEPIRDLIFGGQAFDFWSAVESAKCQLSTQETARLSYRREHVDLDVVLDRDAFDVLMEPHIREVRRCVVEAIKGAQLDASDIDIVVRTGGSAQLPAFNAMLDELFGAGKVEARPAFSSVAAGLAEIGAGEDWSED